MSISNAQGSAQVSTVGLLFIGDETYSFPTSQTLSAPAVTVVLASGARILIPHGIYVLTSTRGYVDPGALTTNDFVSLTLPNQQGTLSVQRDTSIDHTFLDVRRTLQAQVIAVYLDLQGSSVAPLGTVVTWDTSLGTAPTVPTTPQSSTSYCLCLVPGSNVVCDITDEEDFTDDVTFTLTRPVAPPPPPPFERLQFTSTGDIHDAHGNPIFLRGWNWGNWGLAVEQDAQDHLAEGVNIVRVVLRWYGPYPGTINSFEDGAPGLLNTTNLTIFDNYIQWLTSRGIWVNLAVDSDCGQNGNQDTQTFNFCTVNGSSGGQNFWNNLEFRSMFKEVWAFVANRYKNTNRIAWYEPLPEPNADGVSSAQVKEFYSEMIATIRAVDPVTPILIGPKSGYNASLVAQVYDPSFTNVIYTGDFLDPVVANPATFTSKINSLLSLRALYGVPVFIQQLGVLSSNDPGQTLMASALNQLRLANIGYTIWEYKGNGATSYSVYYTSGNSFIKKPAEYANDVSYLQRGLS